MAFVHNNMSGSLFRNDRKTEERQPDYTGSGKINDTEYWISGWVKDSTSGKKFMSLAFTEKNAPQSSPVRPNEDFDDDMPF